MLSMMTKVKEGQDKELESVSGGGIRPCGIRNERAQKNRCGNRSGERGKTQKNERVDGGNDLSVISQGSLLTGPALHQMVVIEVKHVAKVPVAVPQSKYTNIKFMLRKCYAALQTCSFCL